MPVYFIQSSQIEGQSVRLEADLAHHLKDVLRLKIGETVAFVDEQPLRYRARVVSIKPHLLFCLEGLPLAPSKKTRELHLAVALLKRDKMDWLVQKATELGVSKLTPILCERSVIHPDQKRLQHQMARWQKIAREAAQQSCRWQIPHIETPLTFKTLIAKTEQQGLNLIFSGRPTALPLKTILRKFQTGGASVTCLIGPEGGWTDAELSTAEVDGFHARSLGDTILRTETAAMAAVAILQYECAFQE